MHTMNNFNLKKPKINIGCLSLFLFGFFDINLANAETLTCFYTYGGQERETVRGRDSSSTPYFKVKSVTGVEYTEGVMIEDDRFLISGALVDYQPQHAFLVFFLDKKTQKFTATALEEPKYTEKYEAKKISGFCKISDD